MNFIPNSIRFAFRGMRSSRPGVAFLTAALLVFLGACTGAKNKDGVLKLPMGVDAKTLDPQLVDDLYSGIATSLIYEGLLEYEYLKRPHELRPLLAESMPTISEDGLTYTFKIKKGAKFIDSPHFEGGKGRAVTAHDFVYSFHRVADPKVNSGGFWIFDGKIKGLNEWRDANKGKDEVDYTNLSEGFKALDDHTLQINLTTKYPQLLYVLAMSYTFVVPQEVVSKLGPDFANNPVGTGPYILDTWMREAKITYNKNPNYHGSLYPTEAEEGDDPSLLADAGKKLPFMDRVELHVFVESQPMWLNFLQGNLDNTAIPKDNFDTAIDAEKGDLKKEFADKGVSLNVAPGADVTYLAFNMLDPFFIKAGPKFRQAISLAIDEDERIKVFYNGRGIPAHTPVPPSLPGYDKDFKNPYQAYDVEKAKQLLAEAGFPEGKGVPTLEYEIGKSTTARQMAEDFKRRLEAIGINIKVNVNQFSELLTKINDKKAQMWGIAWGADYPDAENFLQLLYGPNMSPGPNGANFNNAEYNKLFEEIRFELDSPERRAKINRMKQIFVEQMPWVPGIHRVGYSLSQPWLKNFKPGYMGNSSAKFLRVDEERRAQGLKK